MIDETETCLLRALSGDMVLTHNRHLQNNPEKGGIKWTPLSRHKFTRNKVESFPILKKTTIIYICHKRCFNKKRT